MGLSKLKFHKFKHNFRDTINPMCPTNDGIEDTEHFLLLCPSLEVPRRDLLAGFSALLPPIGHTDFSNEFLMQILLYGDKDFPDSLRPRLHDVGSMPAWHDTGMISFVSKLPVYMMSVPLRHAKVLIRIKTMSIAIPVRVHAGMITTSCKRAMPAWCRHDFMSLSPQR